MPLNEGFKLIIGPSLVLCKTISDGSEPMRPRNEGKVTRRDEERARVRSAEIRRLTFYHLSKPSCGSRRPYLPLPSPISQTQTHIAHDFTEVVSSTHRHVSTHKYVSATEQTYTKMRFPFPPPSLHLQPQTSQLG